LIKMDLEENAVYLYALGLLKGVGLQTLLRIIRSYPSSEALTRASLEELHHSLDRKLAEYLHQNLENQWPDAVNTAREAIQRHIDKGVTPIPVTSEKYPPLLKLIPDAPAILYAKGDISVLQQSLSVAVVGTREPTQQGMKVAHRIARECASRGYVIISGLAKGIDTAGHTGALDAGGKTIAVFGTALDKIYPAENKELAERISKEAGVVVSELPFGQRGFKTAFVQRDRIQSGLSLCVIPVQTGCNGGTMHTVKFARAQKRLVVCPRPVEAEKTAVQYEGIWFLIREGKVRSFSADNEQHYTTLEETLRKVQAHLLPPSKEIREEREKAVAVDPKPRSRNLWDAEVESS
jgi:DNA processing protein